jgi:pilus assembly protein CpaB
MRNTVIRVVAALVLAAGGTLALVQYVETAKAEAVADEAQVNVLVVQAPIAKGTPASDIAARVQAVPMPARVKAGDAVASVAELGTMRATVDLVPGEQLVRARFAEAATALRGQAPAGLHQITVPLDPERALGGNLAAGDTVGVLLSFEPETTHLELHKVTVTDVRVAEGGSAEAEGAPAKVPAAIKGRYLVTLAVTAAGAEQLVFATENGSIWLTAEPADAPTDPTVAVNRANVIR